MVSTRTQQYGIAPNTKALPVPPETLLERRQRWSHLLRGQHYEPIISEVLDEELLKYDNSTAIDTRDRSALLRDCALILASAPLVFAAAVDGNLVRRMLNDVELQREYAVIQGRAHEQPSIYIHQLNDDHGNAPTPNQYLVIRDMVLDYLAEGQNSEHALQIDNMTLPPVSKKLSDQDHRKYLQTKNRSSKRIETLHRFCEGVQRRYQETATSAQDTPFRFPPGECGYSKNSHVRLAQHRARQSSNYVMNLVEDICAYLYRSGQFKQHYRMHQFIIYLIFRPAQAAIAEIFCSGLLQVWVENGGGFNAYPAGRSVATAGQVSGSDWIAHETWVRQISPVEGNMQLQRDRAAQWSEALDWERNVIADEEMMKAEACEGVRRLRLR
jgi:hypothetical protein